MKTIHLSDAELVMVRHAVHMYLDSFGHNEADVVEQVKAVLRKVSDAADATDDDVSDATQLIG